METKNKMAETETSDPLLKLFYESFHLKNLYRQGWLKRGIPKEKCESVADHSFGVVLMSFMIAKEHFPELDISKLMKLALIHDLPEVFTGDKTPSDNVTPKQKELSESKAFRRLFSGFKDADEYQKLWKEYSKQSSAEARFVLQIDKLEMALQASIYEKTTKHDLQEFYDSVLSVITEPKLRKILQRIISEMN